MKAVTPPPVVALSELVRYGDASVRREEVCTDFPLLHRFVEAVSFQDGDTIFADQAASISYFVGTQPGDPSEIEAALRAEIRGFNARYASGTPARIAAFLALGSSIFREDYVERQLEE